MVYLYGYTLYKSWLTGIDEGRTHQGSWGRVGDVAGTAKCKTQVQCKAEGRETLTGREPTSSWAAPPYAYACGCVLANAQTAYYIYHLRPFTDQPIAHLRGQHPMTASEPPAKWCADIHDVVCRVEEGRTAAARRRRRGNQGKEEWNSKMADSKAHKVPVPTMIINTVIIKGHSLRRACLQPATNTQNSKPRPLTANAKRIEKLEIKQNTAGRNSAPYFVVHLYTYTLGHRVYPMTIKDTSSCGLVSLLSLARCSCWHS